MNIFVTSKCPVECAVALADTHVVKMGTECLQMAVAALYRQEIPLPLLPLNKSGKTYGNSHPRHPCTLWAGDTRGNYLWLIEHGIAICEEYTYRYGKRHGVHDNLYILRDLAHWIPEGEMTPFAVCMPDEYKVDCPHESYRNFYIIGKQSAYNGRGLEWAKNRSPPNWYVIDFRVSLEKEESIGTVYAA